MPIVRILYIDHYAGSNQHGMEFRPFYLAREWVRAGHHVRIVAALGPAGGLRLAGQPVRSATGTHDLIEARRTVSSYNSAQAGASEAAFAMSHWTERAGDQIE